MREGEIAEALGLSRTPVREAFRRLTAERLVRYERNRGVQAQGWSARDLYEIFSLRTTLEPFGCRLAATAGGEHRPLVGRRGAATLRTRRELGQQRLRQIPQLVRHKTFRQLVGHKPNIMQHNRIRRSGTESQPRKTRSNTTVVFRCSARWLVLRYLFLDVG
ncbi:GntR family transcriptional regulator [Nocardia wallacei]|uniref:GntR family transcriptional regulator n=1 Tax=Nocardia wallacei TaxID=480035 RepID=UPI003CC7D4F3